MKRIFRLAATLAVALSGISMAHAEQYPNKSIRLVVPYTAGGTADIIARAVSEELSATLKQPVVVEFKPGGAQILGAQAVATAKPDGYTLFMGTGTSQVLNPLLRKELPYNPTKDFVPVAMLTENIYVLAVPASSPAQDLRSFIEMAKAKPNELAYGTWGAGNINHLGIERLSRLAGVSLRAIPYKGTAQSDLDLISGRIDFILTPPNIMSFVRDGRARVLAVTSMERGQFAPDVPTVAEQGYPEFSVTGWFGVFAPAGTPDHIVKLLNKEISKAMQRQSLKERLAADGLITVSTTPEEFQDRINRDIKEWSAVVDDLGLRETL